MCRRNQLFGCCAMSLGVGVLLGSSLESGVLTLCLTLGLIGAAISCFRQR